jgi:dTDP-4-dehydrorhamnose 3,5-epimerase-like enzyme
LLQEDTIIITVTRVFLHPLQIINVAVVVVLLLVTAVWNVEDKPGTRITGMNVNIVSRGVL